MDSSRNGWSLKAVSSLVSRDDVDDVEELFVSHPSRRRRPGADVSKVSGNHRRAHRDGSGEPTFAVRLLSRIFEGRRRDDLRACFAAWLRALRDDHHRSRVTGLQSTKSESMALRSDRSKVASEILRLRSRVLGRHPVAEGDGACLVLRLAFNAFLLELNINREEVAIRRRFRSTQLRNLGKQILAYDAEQTSLYTQLLLRGWQNCVTFRTHAGAAANKSTNSVSRRRKKTGLTAVSLLERFGCQNLAQQCILLWRNFVAQGLAMQVILMRERLQRADSECCVLRSEDERLRAEAERCKALLGEVEVRSATAERELLKRSQQEFAQLRELQVELAKLRAKSAASTAPTFNLEPLCAATFSIGSAVVASAKTPQAIATVSGGMVASFTMSAVRAWMRLYFLAWHAIAASQELVLTVAAQAASNDACLCANRVLHLWRCHAQRSSAHRAKLRIGELMQKQYCYSLAYATLRAWNGNIDRISCLVTPLSVKDSVVCSPSPTMLDSTAQYYSAVARSKSPFQVSSQPPSERNPTQKANVTPVELWPSVSPGSVAYTDELGMAAKTMASAEMPATMSRYRLDSVVDHLLDGLGGRVL